MQKGEKAKSKLDNMNFLDDDEAGDVRLTANLQQHSSTFLKLS
jgi:hypothetical protein